MAESGATSDEHILSKEEMKYMIKTFTHLVNTKNLAELREIMYPLPVEMRKEFIYSFGTDKDLMFQACFAKATLIVKYFIVECKVNVNEVAKIGDETLTALFVAIKTSNIELIDFLLNHGADINWCDPENRSAIVYACFQNKMEAAYALKNRGVDINDDTNIKLCAKNVSYFKRALKLGARVNYINEDGETILMKAVEYGDLDVITLLLKEKADLYLRSYATGRNALDTAHVCENEDVLVYFKTNSVYPLAERVRSYDLCGALRILLEKNKLKAIEYWRISARLRKKHGSTIASLVKECPLQKTDSIKMGIEDIKYEYIALSDYLRIALSVVCRIIEVTHPFLQASFEIVAYNPDLLRRNLTFNTLREFCLMNSTSLMPLCNGVFVGMTCALSMCEKRLLELDEDVGVTVYFIEALVELITEDFLPIVKQWPANHKAFMVYKQLLVALLCLIDYVVEVGCSNNDTLDESIRKVASIYLECYPTSLLLIAIERGFSFKTVLSLIAAGADVNATDYIRNKPLHLLAEQPDHLPDKNRIRQLLIDCGAEIDATNDFGIKPRISMIEM